ncbi:MAG: hypothetical protein EWV82_17215 [Microcystis aeruginosa Ma_AC_P_19900807_S299]|jgi:uncharacterized transporter YbjL|nr:MAG: hypothetical protein EWV82_17215 [Microcystis aeruginosa Ma_AC_P_19900807_S299]
MLKKTSQFSGKAQPNTQHLNPSESFCWVYLGVLLGFLTSTQPTLVSLGLWLGFLTSTQPTLVSLGLLLGFLTSTGSSLLGMVR